MLLLDAKQKKQMVGIVFMMLIGGILESLGIALIAPIMEILIKPELIDESKALSFLIGPFNMICSKPNLIAKSSSISDTTSA